MLIIIFNEKWDQLQRKNTIRKCIKKLDEHYYNI